MLLSESSADTAVESLGNTIPNSYKKPKEVKRYCFTLNNYTDKEFDEIKKTADTAMINYVIGKEVGESGTPHLQGYINMPKKKSLSAVIKLFKNKRIHFEQCRGSEKQNIDYCIEDGDWCSNFYEEPEQLKLITNFKPWQEQILSIIKNSANERTVNWFWETEGGVGKSSFCKYLCAKHNAIYIDEGKKSDLINIIYNVKEINSKSIIVIDVPRDNGNNVSYKAIEQIKNGMICNTKYETGMKLFNSPHIIIFSNYYPDTSKLSKDRWNIVKIE